MYGNADKSGFVRISIRSPSRQFTVVLKIVLCRPRRCDAGYHYAALGYVPVTFSVRIVGLNSTVGAK